MTIHRAAILGSAGLLALSVLAFWPGYLSRPSGSIDRYTHGHALAGTLWLCLLLAQALLVQARRIRGHAAVGWASLVLAPSFVLSSVLLAHYRFSRMASGSFDKEAYALYLPLSAAGLFALAFCLGLAFRRVSRLHGRFMLCTALPLFDPVLGRVLAFNVVTLPQFWHYQLMTFSLEIGVLLVLHRSLPRDATLRRPFGVFAVTYSITLALWFLLARTLFWFKIADWFRSLPLTT